MFRDDRANTYAGRAGLGVALVAIIAGTAIRSNTGSSECAKQVEANIAALEFKANHHRAIRGLGVITTPKANTHIEVVDRTTDPDGPLLKNPAVVGCDGRPLVTLIATRQTPEADGTYQFETIPAANASAAEVSNDGTATNPLPALPLIAKIPSLQFEPGENGNHAHFSATASQGYGILAQVQ
jgi:hypothetical protein